MAYAAVESAVLREMIERTLFSIRNDETRFHLNGVFFESDGSKSRMVSTDGHRLSKVERTIAGGSHPFWQRGWQRRQGDQRRGALCAWDHSKANGAGAEIFHAVAVYGRQCVGPRGRRMVFACECDLSP